jgi:hypothetical protein
MRRAKIAAEALAIVTRALEAGHGQAKVKAIEAESIANNNVGNDALLGRHCLGEMDEEKVTTPSTSTKLIQFLAGVGVGIGAGLLIAPSTGKQMRDRLFRKVTHTLSKEPEGSS